MYRIKSLGFGWFWCILFSIANFFIGTKKYFGIKASSISFYVSS